MVDVTRSGHITPTTFQPQCHSRYMETACSISYKEYREWNKNGHKALEIM